MDSEAIQDDILRVPLEELFDFKTPSFAPPSEARIFKSIVCEECGESAAEHKIRLQGGKKVCIDCFSDYTRGC